jgi:hypothetical protein
MRGTGCAGSRTTLLEFRLHEGSRGRVFGIDGGRLGVDSSELLVRKAATPGNQADRFGRISGRKRLDPGSASQLFLGRGLEGRHRGLGLGDVHCQVNLGPSSVGLFGSGIGLPASEGPDGDVREPIDAIEDSTDPA